MPTQEASPWCLFTFPTSFFVLVLYSRDSLQSDVRVAKYSPLFAKAITLVLYLRCLMPTLKPFLSLSVFLFNILIVVSLSTTTSLSSSKSFIYIIGFDNALFLIISTTNHSCK